MNKIKKQVLLYFLLVALSVAILFPFVVMISTSLKSLNEIRVSPFKILPEVFRFDNYRAFFQSLPMQLRGMRSQGFISMERIFFSDLH